MPPVSYIRSRARVLASLVAAGTIGHAQHNPKVELIDIYYPPPPEPCCETCAEQDSGDGSSCAVLPPCESEGSVFFSVGLGRTTFARDISFPSAMAKSGKQLYLSSATPGDIRSVSGFYRKAPLTGQRTLHVWYHQEALAATSFDVAALTADAGTNAERITVNDKLRQILTLDYLADIQPLSDIRDSLPDDIKDTTEIPSGAPGFVIRTWFAKAKTAKVDGLYGLPSSEPLGYVVFYRKAETSFPPNWSRTLGIIHRVKSGPSAYKTQSWTHLNNQNGDWTTIHYRGLPSADIKLRRSIRTVGPRSGPNEFTQTHIVEQAALSANGSVGALIEVSNDEEQFDDIGGLKRLIRRTRGANPAGALQRTSRYGWINSPANLATHGRLQWEYHADGNFAHHTYTFSTGANSGSIVTRRPWKNTTWSYGSTAPADSGCVVETTSFTATTLTVTRHLNNTDLLSSEESSWTTSGSIDTLTEKRQYGATSGDVLTTTSAYHNSTAAAHLVNRIAWRTREDGTAESYTYSTPNGSGTYTQTVESGAGDSSGVTRGHRTVSIRKSTGVIDEQTRSWFATVPSATTIQLSTWNIAAVPHDGGTLDAYDFLGRPQGKIHNAENDDYEAIIHGCCGIAYQRTRDGTQTEYFQDELHRHYKQVETTSAGVITTTTARTQRTGTDGMITETRRIADALDVLVSRRHTTTNGETDLVESPDADGDNLPEETSYTYTYPGVGRTLLITHPDGGTSAGTYYADGRIKEISGTAEADATYDYEHNEEDNGIVTIHTRLTSIGGTAEWTRTYADPIGRTVKLEYPTTIHNSPALDHSATSYHSHTADPGSRGKVHTTTDPDGVTTTYAYSPDGTLLTITEAMPGLVGNRVTETRHDAITDTTLGGSLRTVTKINTVTVSTTLQAGDGYGSIHESLGRITTTLKTVPVEGEWSETTQHPDLTRTRQLYQAGRHLATEQRDNTTANAGLGVLISSTTHTYDDLGRPETSTDSRTQTTTYSNLTESGNIRTITDPGSRVTTFTYDSMGRRLTVDAPDTTHDNITHTSYTLRGEIQAEWGDNTYSTFRTYDEQGRLKTLRTKPTLDGSGIPTDDGGQYTSWTYHPERGWLNAKEYPDGQDAGTARDPGPSYTYTAAGRQKTRTWGGGKHTRYDYRQGLLVAKRHFTSAGGDTGTNAGNDPNTPDVGQTYNNRGQLVNVISNATTIHPGIRNLYFYDTTNFRILRELQQVDPDITFTLTTAATAITINFGPIGASISRYIHRKADTLLRNTGADLRDTLSSSSILSIGSTLTYHATDGRLDTVTGDFVGSTATYGYAYEPGSTSNLIKSITRSTHIVENAWFADRDLLDFKENKVGSDTVSKYDYAVNVIGQRTSVAATSSVGTFGSVAPNWNWGYNERGEMESSEHLNASGSSRHYTFDTIGNRTEHREGTHTASGGTATSYTPNAVNQYDAVGSLNPVHDLDGNMTSGLLPTALGALSALGWDGNNQLTEATPNGGSTVKYHYDSFGRRIAQTIGSTRTYWFYDGWNPVAEISGPVHTTGTAPGVTLEKTWLWGLDLSGTLQGAGGVGGLLAVSIEVGAQAGVYHPLYDGNGNIGQYIDSTGSSTPVAKYEYDGFGNSLSTTGTHAAIFPHRFSTKPLDAQTGLYYYGYRWYDPATGRWPSRDPIEEEGGLNLYGFIGNDTLTGWDRLGLDRQNHINQAIEELDSPFLKWLAEKFGIKAALKKAAKKMDEKEANGQDPKLDPLEQGVAMIPAIATDVAIIMGVRGAVVLIDGATEPDLEPDADNESVPGSDGVCVICTANSLVSVQNGFSTVCNYTCSDGSFGTNFMANINLPCPSPLTAAQLDEHHSFE